MDGVAIGVNGSAPDPAEPVVFIVRLFEPACAALHCFVKGNVCVANMKSDIAYGVTMLAQMLCHVAVGQRRTQHDNCFALAQRVAGELSTASLESGIGELGESK